MASVTSLDQDMRNLRLGRYTPQAANEARLWIESILGESLPAGDLLQDVLKDGVVLCRLANLALPPPGIKYKQASMPFMQMENISHFLRACESPPLNMPAHDRFLTVDLYESKDPAQVLQTLSAFSRVAHAVAPSNFPTTIGPAKRAANQSPSPYTRNGPTSPAFASSQANFSPTLSSFGAPMSPALTGGSNASRGTSAALKSATGTVSSWSKKGDQGTTDPAWNIHQYGYMGGASQGNQGVAFGARRQITTAAPHVPSLAEKERKRKEKDEQDQRARLEAEEAERKRRAELEDEEERERRAEEKKWEEETNRVRDEQRRRLEEQKRQWEEQERKWQAEEEARIKEDAALQQHVDMANQRARSGSDARLTGQFLSQYQAEQAGMAPPRSPREQEDTPEKRRVRELEKQLQEARERERQYQLERTQRSRQNSQRSQPGPASEGIARPPSPKESEASWAPADERENLQRQWQGYQSARPLPAGTGLGSTRPLPVAGNSGVLPRASNMSAAEESHPQSQVPDHEQYGRVTVPQNRTERFLASNPAPPVAKPTSHQPAEMGFTSSVEEQRDRERRMESQQKTKAGGWASKSLLEREMERERERQREWEANQQATNAAARDPTEGSGEGKSWDVNQYGYTGGDSQNRGSSTGSGISFGGRRQIIGPRPLP